MARNLTIRVSDEAARWARRKAAEEDTSISRWLGDLLERQMRQGEAYWAAYEHWKKLRPERAPVPASQRWSRTETHARRG